MRIDKVMTQPVVSVHLDDNLKTVKDIFDQGRFHHLLVVENNVLLGVISDRDLLKAISPNIGTVNERAKDEASLNKKVHQIMSRKPICLPPSADVYEAIHLFNHNKVSCIPIVSEERVPLGIVSWRDIFRVIEARHTLKQANLKSSNNQPE
jgi:acetoin utilization protein AcuB